MPILINRTYERYFPHDDDSDVCEADETGFHSEDEPVSFRELVEALRHGEPSTWPARGDIYEWISHDDTNDGTREFYEQGIHENGSIHYSRSNPPRNAKWWRLAFRAAGLLRESV